ncbi:MAG: hypothetical protein ACYC1W_00820 [Gemmatimonadaceae bacterium]
MIEYRYPTGQPVSWFKQSKARSNQHCLYCGRFVGKSSTLDSNREHLIGRNFVPKGYLGATDFNFIFRSCVGCNRAKADAEGHVSVISLHNSAARANDRHVDEVAAHKAGRAFYPGKKAQLVKDSSTTHTVESSFGSLKMSATFVAPPELDRERAATLAFRQTQALFSLVTAQDPRNGDGAKILSESEWQYVDFYPSRDWGNPRLVEIASRVRNWTSVAYVVSARGHFRAVLRAHEDPSREWFWALEWNREIRGVGAIYRGSQSPPVFVALPALRWIRLPGPSRRMREEAPLDPQTDFLFEAP